MNPSQPGGPTGPSPDDAPVDHDAPPATGRGDRTGEAERAPFHLGYRPELDGVRAVAVGMILFSHLFWFSPWIARHAQGLFLGVDLFFALSGFLLTSLLLEERGRNGRFSFRGFYERRALRLLPSLYVMLILLIITVVALQGNVRLLVDSSLAVVFYVANFMWIYNKHGFSVYLEPTWSLSVEEQYYLLFFPALVLLLKFVHRTRTILIVLGSMIVLVATWRLWLSFGADVNIMMLYARTDTRADALLVGPFAAFVVYAGYRPGTGFKILTAIAVAFSVAMALFSSLHDLWVHRWALLPLDASLMIVILAITVSANAANRLLSTAPMVWVGRISYELYIVHYPIYIIVAEQIGGSPVHGLLALALTFTVSAMLHHFVAQRFLTVKRRRAQRLRGFDTSA